MLFIAVFGFVVFDILLVFRSGLIEHREWQNVRHPTRVSFNNSSQFRMHELRWVTIETDRWWKFWKWRPLERIERLGTDAIELMGRVGGWSCTCSFEELGVFLSHHPLQFGVWLQNDSAIEFRCWIRFGIDWLNRSNQEKPKQNWTIDNAIDSNFSRNQRPCFCNWPNCLRQKDKQTKPYEAHAHTHTHTQNENENENNGPEPLHRQGFHRLYNSGGFVSRFRLPSFR